MFPTGGGAVHPWIKTPFKNIIISLKQLVISKYTHFHCLAYKLK
jgi:hypothetical protein